PHTGWSSTGGSGRSATATSTHSWPSWRPAPARASGDGRRSPSRRPAAGRRARDRRADADHAGRPGDRAAAYLRGTPPPGLFRVHPTELLRRWYGAQGWRLVDCEVDLRVGG